MDITVEWHGMVWRGFVFMGVEMKPVSGCSLLVTFSMKNSARSEHCNGRLAMLLGRVNSGASSIRLYFFNVIFISDF